MKNYPSKHSKNHQWIGRDYWSNYDKEYLLILILKEE